MKVRMLVVLGCGIVVGQLNCGGDSAKPFPASTGTGGSGTGGAGTGGVATGGAATGGVATGGSSTGGIAMGGTAGGGSGGYIPSTGAGGDGDINCNDPDDRRSYPGWCGGDGGGGGGGAGGGGKGGGGVGGSGGSGGKTSTAVDAAPVGPEAGPEAAIVDVGSDGACGANPANVTCISTKDQCVPSSCYCSPPGGWACTTDCRGGLPVCDGGAGTGGRGGSGGVGGAGGASGTGGTTGTAAFSPLCAGLLTAAGVAPTKNGICTDSDPQLCYKTCGPQSIGFKSETCVAGVYIEQAGCSFPPGDYSCYRIPATIDPSCPAEVPQASTVCSVATCTLCNVNGGYLDSSGAARTGYCVCPAPSTSTGVSKWSCAAATAWPCPAGQGC